MQVDVNFRIAVKLFKPGTFALILKAIPTALKTLKALRPQVQITLGQRAEKVLPPPDDE